MLLDIIVPHYKEDWEIVRPFFDILNAQKNVDFSKFRVWLIHDGVEKFPYDYFYPGNVQVVQIENPHGGVSVCRNKGLDMSDAKWVMFCDCDDCFTSVFALQYVFHVLESEDSDKFDLLWGSFFMSGDGKLQIADKMNYVFIHNKYYRRSFLEDHKIRFSEDLYMSEDSAFNTWVKMEIGPYRTGTINSKEPFYAWCRRPGSVTMDFDKWIYNAEGHFNRNLYVLELHKSHHTDGVNMMIVRTITDAYAMLTRSNVQGDMSGILKRVAKFYKEHEKEYLSVPKERLQQALAISDKDACISIQNRNERLGFDEWINTVLLRN